MPTAEDELDFLRKQVLTSRNVRGGWLVDVALGGLNYQIEHHLFPNMPRANLRRAQPIVRAYCAGAGHRRTRRPGWSSRTGRRCGTCTRWAGRCVAAENGPARSPRRWAVPERAR